MKKSDLKKRAAEIVKLAEKSGVQSNFFFLTTFKRYEVQLGILDNLEKTIKEEGLLVQKEYVKGRKNLYSNPAVAEYNRTADSANKTVSTLLKIIKDSENEDGKTEDPLMKLLAENGQSV